MEVVKTTSMKMVTQRTSYMTPQRCRKTHFVVSSSSSCAAWLWYSTFVRALFVVQFLGDLHKNVAYQGECRRSSLSNDVLYKNVNKILYWVWFGPYRCHGGLSLNSSTFSRLTVFFLHINKKKQKRVDWQIETALTASTIAIWTFFFASWTFSPLNSPTSIT